MGYYHEVGIGGPIDLDEALRWYALAQRHGNTDAGERLAALSQPAPQVLSRVEHDEITESKLVRSRTRAKERSEAQKVRDGYLAGQPQPQPQAQAQPQGQGQGQGRRRDSRQVVDLIRKNTLGSYQPQPQPQPQQAHGRYHTEHANTLPPNQVGITISRPPSAHPHPQPPPHQTHPYPQPQSQPQIPPPYTQPPLPSSSSTTQNPNQNPNQIQNQNPNPTLRPGPGPGAPSGNQSYPTANRYTLVDPGSGSAPRSDSRSPSNRGDRGDTRSPSTGPGGPGARPPPRRGPSGGIVVSGGVSTSSPYNTSNPTTGPTGVPGAPPPTAAVSPPRPTGPQTFAEMGISGAKAEDEKCVVM
ncbi:HCP-like protein [Lentinula edodes]|uniref:HCP-like protein n=1 Tax=Lentinula edodes TaxID=5353 RepID=A0A1Q3EBC7_LENED|nr:HCP-like protein [Lentinula edodes]